MLNIILWLLFGALAGWLASVIMGARTGLIGDIIIGILGAVLGGWLVTAFGSPGISGFNLTSLIVAVLGGIVLIWISRLLRRDTTLQH
jgi:uncharacterized membrane protein YeaQ/YmgE (transglycosylase-associated protein family)